MRSYGYPTLNRPDLSRRFVSTVSGPKNRYKGVFLDSQRIPQNVQVSDNHYTVHFSEPEPVIFCAVRSVFFRLL